MHRYLHNVEELLAIDDDYLARLSGGLDDGPAKRRPRNDSDDDDYDDYDDYDDDDGGFDNDVDADEDIEYDDEDDDDYRR